MTDASNRKPMPLFLKTGNRDLDADAEITNAGHASRPALIGTLLRGSRLSGATCSAPKHDGQCLKKNTGLERLGQHPVLRQD
jgi:hypothetical protein